MTSSTTKILYNACYGGFEFSQTFIEEFNKRHPEKADILDKEGRWDLSKENRRTDKDVIALVEELGTEKSSCSYSKIKVREVKTKKLPFVQITEYDGLEGISMAAISYLKILVDFIKKSEEPNVDVMAEIKTLKELVSDIIDDEE